MQEGLKKDSFLGLKLVPLSRKEALCFVSTYDRPFLLSKVAGILTVHDCHILEADIHIRDGIVTDLYKVRIPQKYEPSLLENMLYKSLQKVLKSDTNIEKEIFLWEKKRGVIRDEIVPRFGAIKDPGIRGCKGSLMGFYEFLVCRACQDNLGHNRKSLQGLFQ